MLLPERATHYLAGSRPDCRVASASTARVERRRTSAGRDRRHRDRAPGRASELSGQVASPTLARSEAGRRPPRTREIPERARSDRDQVCFQNRPALLFTGRHQGHPINESMRIGDRGRAGKIGQKVLGSVTVVLGGLLQSIGSTAASGNASRDWVSPLISKAAVVRVLG